MIVLFLSTEEAEALLPHLEDERLRDEVRNQVSIETVCPSLLRPKLSIWYEGGTAQDIYDEGYAAEMMEAIRNCHRSLVVREAARKDDPPRRKKRAVTERASA